MAQLNNDWHNTYNFDEDFKGSGNSYILLIEWDGKRPPTTWYNRLARFGLTTRRNAKKDETPIARRFGGQGIAFQEGAILVRSHSTANILASLASEMGAVAVSVGSMTHLDGKMSEADIKALDRISTRLGKRGRPASDNEGDYVTFCKDCGVTSQIHGVEPLTCPDCGSVSIRSRRGTIEAYFPATRDLLDLFIRGAFNNGKLETPVFDDNGKPLPEKSHVKDIAAEHAETLRGTELYNQLVEAVSKGWINENEAMQFLAGAFYMMVTIDETEKQVKRIEAIADFVKRGGSASGLNMASPAGDFDLFTVSAYGNKALWIMKKLLGS